MSNTLDEARAVERAPIVAGGKYRFYSTMAGQDGAGFWPATYSAQECEALEPVTDLDEECEPMWTVRFEDGAELQVFEGELNGFYFETGQWHGPFAAVLEGKS